jgi:hypothetical protein
MDTPDVWLSVNYGIWYDNAKHDERRSNLYFDPRAWTSKEVKVFFEDLRFGNHDVYLQCLERFPERRQHSIEGLRRAEKRYRRWLIEQNTN